MFSPQLTFADIFTYETFSAVCGLEPKCTDDFPGIKMCVDKVGSLPKIADYIKKRKETPF